MPQAANIVILDGRSTPVTHTFVPSKVSDLVTTFYGPGSTLSTREQVVITRREPTATVAGKVNLKIQLPTEQTVDGQVVQAFQDLVSMDFVLAPKGTATSRKDARTLARNLLADPLVVAVIDNFDGVF